MPRIDPFQLLKCLSVLLGPTGGIKSREEVHRLANLMTKFSKKLVSKCIYIQILKTTDTELLSQFMDAGGWSLIHMWLTDGIVAKNWALIQELLELLLLCPVKIERLKSNNCPKLIKGLSKEVSHQVVRILAGHLVEQWLKIVKGEAAPNSVPAQIIGGLPSEIGVNPVGQLVEHQYTTTNSGEMGVSSVEGSSVQLQNHEASNASLSSSSELNRLSQKSLVAEDSSSTTANKQSSFVTTNSTSSIPPSVPVCKITIRDGDQVLAKVETEASNINNAFKENSTHEMNGEASEKSRGGEEGGEEGSATSNEDKEEASEGSSEGKSTKDFQLESEKNKDSDKATGKDTTSESNKSSDRENNRDSHKSDDKKSLTGSSTTVSSEKKSSSHGSSKSSSSSKHSSSSSHRSSSSSHKSSSHRSSSSRSSSSSKSSRDKDGRHSSSSSSSKHGSSSSSSSRSKSDRDKEREKEKEKQKKDQAEKDKATLEKVQAQAISSKLGKIPRKKPEDEKDSLLRKSSTDSRDSSKENKDKSEARKGSGAAAPAPVLEKKQISISIENRKNSQDSSRPKTVKTFNSKFRSTGLEEDVKPPVPRAVATAKKPIALPPLEKKLLPTKPLASLKRSSPLRETGLPSDKRAKLSLEPPITSPTDEKKGAIKLIPPKPKPMVLQESDMFMDALTASTKSKEPRKRKRRTSLSKDGPTDAKKSDKSDTEGGHESPQHPSSPPSADERSPLALKPNFKFYQDTLETDEDKEDKEERSKKEEESTERVKSEVEDNEDDESSITNVVKNEIAASMAKSEAGQEKDEDAESVKGEAESPDAEDATSETSDFPKNGRSLSPLPEIRYVDGLRSVLLLQKRKGPKKSLKWKTDLESVRYFELDETERVNVTKNFTDMKQMEKMNEREAFQMARKLSTEDLMEEKTRWKPLIPIDLQPALVEPGKDSREKDIQYAREKGILQALYFNRSMIPDSAAEPDEERHHTITDPKIIPLDDLTGNKESEKDFTGVSWPEPKPLLTPTPPPVMQPPGGYHYPPFGHNQPPMMPPMGQQGPMGPMPPMGPQGPMQMGPGPMNPMGPPDMGNPMPGPTSGLGGGGGWRTGDGKVVVPDVGMNPMQPPMPPNMQGFPPPGMDGPMGPPGMMGPPMFNQQEGFGMMGPDDMGYGNYQGPPGPGMFGPGHNFPGVPPRGGGPMHPNRGRGNGPGWFRGGGAGGGGPPMRGGGGGGGGGWRGGWRGNGKQPPICRQFTKNGYCRVGDKCQYLHPGVNCPPF